MTTTPSILSPGQQATVTVTVSAASGNEAGVFVDADGVGSFETLSGQGLAEVPAGLTHNAPKPMTGGSAQYSFLWTAPAQPGAVRFFVSTVAANGNGGSSGDLADEANIDLVYGCEPQQYFRDFDGDGYGRDSLTLVHCSGQSPEGYVAMGGDCDDNRDTTYPGATEFCNLRDDDCDGEIDNDALPVEQYPDGDGDGFYGIAEYQTGETFVGCEMEGDAWAGEPGDCEPSNATINPDAEEICNLYDDNCDGDVDERVRPLCGEGWCRREASTCDEASCEPGPPQVELCNLLDDDCDGVVDNGTTCPAGEVCITGTCQPDVGGADTSGGMADGPTGEPMGASATATEGDAGSGGPGADGGGSSGGGCRIVAAEPISPWGPGGWWMLGWVVMGPRRRRRSG